MWKLEFWKLEFWKLEIEFGNQNFEELFKDENLRNKLK